MAIGATAEQKTVFVFVKIPESVSPVERGRKYEDPLDKVLRVAKLGEVTGGGSQLGPDGRVSWVGVDVELFDVETGIPFVKQALLKLGAPKDTTLTYETAGRRVDVAIGSAQQR
ncbi:hypothetical protein BH10PSE18_BH10PSE18_36730 [soil metagenome]